MLKISDKLLKLHQVTPVLRRDGLWTHLHRSGSKDDNNKKKGNTSDILYFYLIDSHMLYILLVQMLYATTDEYLQKGIRMLENKIC